MGTVERRIVAIVLPQIACEIARQKAAGEGRKHGPVGVILEPDGGGADAIEVSALSAVEDEARRYGVRPGQRVAEASVLLAGLAVHRVTHGELDAALGRVAEVALAFGPTAALQLRPADPASPRSPWGDAPFDTVWLDVTGAAHLVGGEEALLDELAERVDALGHRVRLAIASGPRLAQALARWPPGLTGAPGRHPIAGPGSIEGTRAMALLPVHALPIDPETASFLVRLGVLAVGDLARLPRAAASARLGARADLVLDLAGGKDPSPLLPYAPPRVIAEEAIFEEGVESTEALLFVLRGMTSRAAVRLGARGEACTRIEVVIPLDRSIAKLRAANAEGAPPEDALAEGAAAEDERGSAPVEIGFHVDLPAPLAAAGDLLRAVRAKLERIELSAPAIGVRLLVPQIVPARRVQLDLSRDRAVSPDSLPALLAELSAEIGPERVGVLSIEDAHRPEARSRLVPVTLSGEGKRGRGKADQLSFPGEWSRRKVEGVEPVRMLEEPIPLGKIGNGAMVAVTDAAHRAAEPQIFAVEKLSFLMRLHEVEWWTRSPASRDYARAWLTSGKASGEALVYVDRATGKAFLQGWFE